MCFIAFTSIFCWVFFMYQLEGYTFLLTPSESFYQFFLLLTTANFPDVMMPAVYENFSYCLIFVVYLVIGMFFLLNLLLANVYNQYSKRFENLAEKYQSKRLKCIMKIFERFDSDKDGALTREETQAFITYIYDLSSNPNNKIH